MTGRTHRLVSGSAAWVSVVAVGAPAYLAAGAAVVASLTASLPDVDQKVGWLPHRGPTHWPLVQLLVFAVPVVAVAYWSPVRELVVAVAALAAAAWFGCLAHSCADAMTVQGSGIKLLWPISRRGYHLMPRRLRVRVGRRSRSEAVFFVAYSAIVLCFTYAHFRYLITA
jgi:membrane-bound metal-dependent hydrolase YbcI (DUF457 family)